MVLHCSQTWGVDSRAAGARLAAGDGWKTAEARWGCTMSDPLETPGAGSTSQPPLDPERKNGSRGVAPRHRTLSPAPKGWTWRKKIAHQILGPFDYRQTSESPDRSIPLPAAHYFGNIDPQPDCVITTEIASGRFEDDIRRMRMAAWHGADHMMVIRTAGQSHFDGLRRHPGRNGRCAHQP